MPKAAAKASPPLRWNDLPGPPIPLKSRARSRFDAGAATNGDRAGEPESRLPTGCLKGKCANRVVQTTPYAPSTDAAPAGGLALLIDVLAREAVLTLTKKTSELQPQRRSK
jgi:hypothetical protein